VLGFLLSSKTLDSGSAKGLPGCFGQAGIPLEESVPYLNDKADL
jgi:hypothetical protein